MGQVKSNLIRSKVLTILAQRPAEADRSRAIGQTDIKTRVRVFILALVFILLFLLGQRLRGHSAKSTQDSSIELVIPASRAFQQDFAQKVCSVPASLRLRAQFYFAASGQDWKSL
jgi:hypothetical protein